MPMEIRTDEYDIVNRNTGWKKSLEAGSTINTAEDKFHARERRKKEEEKKYRRRQSKELGDFVLLRVKKIPVDLDPATLARLTLLATYLDYKNRLMLTPEIPMRKTDLPRILNLSERAAKGFVSEVKDKFLLVRDGDLYLSKEYYRGEDKKYKKDSKQKLFIESTRQLYYKLKPREHRYFGYVIRIIPYINREFNILCKNPDETVFDRIEPLSIGEICDIVRYDSHHSNEFLNGLTKCMFLSDGESQSLCAIVQAVGNGVVGYGMFVNPRIIYNGSDYNKVEVLHFYFPLKKTKNYPKNK